MKKNLVMAAAKGYSFQELEPFLLSFKKNCTSADLVLFVDDLSDFTTEKIKNCLEGVQLVEIPTHLKNKLIIDLRWNMYKNFLEEHTDYEKIFVTDIADVIFQADIFEKFSKQKNFLVYAAEGITIEEDPGGFNQLYVRHFCGEEIYQKLKSKTVICCGTVCGSRDEMKNLFTKMIELLQRSTAWGDEQAAMIYIIHNKIIPTKNLIKSDVETGEILTCSVLKNYQVADGKIQRGDGKFPAVVHQYNRKPELVNFVDEVHREKVFDFDENFTDFQSLADQIFSLIEVQKWQEATKIFVGNLLYNPEIKNCGGKLLKIYQLILTKSLPQNYESETLNASVQNALALALSVRFDQNQLEKLGRYIGYSRQSLRTIISPLKMFMTNALMQFADRAYKSEDKIACLNYLRQIEQFNLTQNQNFYLNLAKVYREAGEKEKALETYKKALDALN